MGTDLNTDPQRPERVDGAGDGGAFRDVSESSGLFCSFEFVFTVYTRAHCVLGHMRLWARAPVRRGLRPKSDLCGLDRASLRAPRCRGRRGRRGSRGGFTHTPPCHGQLMPDARVETLHVWRPPMWRPVNTWPSHMRPAVHPYTRRDKEPVGSTKSPDRAQIVPRSSPDRAQIVPRSCPDRGVPRSCPTGPPTRAFL